MEEMHKAKYGERMWSFYDLSESTALPDLHMFTNLEALQIPSFWVFMEASSLRHD